MALEADTVSHGRTLVVRGTNSKPVASEQLATAMGRIDGLGGTLLLGYPVIGSAEGKVSIDAVLISPRVGVVVFDLVEGTELGDFADRQDEAVGSVMSRLFTHKQLLTRQRSLSVPVEGLTFAPGVSALRLPKQVDYPIAVAETLETELTAQERPVFPPDAYRLTLSALQNISSIRRSRSGKRSVTEGTLGHRLAELENSIATLDRQQSKAVIETAEGVQRIRGLAGSGKTIILALKAAYLNSQHEDWSIAVTFNTRSLKGQLRKYISSFVFDAIGEEPDWAHIRILNSWGGQGGGAREGLYSQFCAANGVPFYDFVAASRKFGRENAFAGACAEAVAAVERPELLYDAILVDEAQDLPPSFLRMCYHMLKPPHRLVYAYDELQTLSGQGMASTEHIFGVNEAGSAVVSFDPPPDSSPARDIVLKQCYRNSRPVLTTAHSLGFGIYRRQPAGATTPIVQMFAETSLWSEIGYEVVDGKLQQGEQVALARTALSSPLFLERHTPLDQLIQFLEFDDKAAQDQWVADEIERNLRVDELKHDDVVVINTDPLTTRNNLGPLRQLLRERGIDSHLAGVDTQADTFFEESRQSVTFTGIHRAKGNEAGMVYVCNAHEGFDSVRNLAKIRNRLFTAITRSKAWVRVVGYGPGMHALRSEFEAVQAADWQLRFLYPTKEELSQLDVIHREITQQEAKKLESRSRSLAELVEEMQEGQLYPQDLDPELRQALIRLLGGGAADK